MYTITEIENTIKTSLEPLKASLGVRTIKTYSGELEKEDFKRLIGQLPAIYIIYGGSKYIDHEARQIEYMEFYLFCLDQNLRAEEEARQGGRNNPGTYAMLNSIRSLMLNKSLGLTLSPFIIESEDIVGFKDGISIYVARYHTFQALLAPLS